MARFAAAVVAVTAAAAVLAGCGSGGGGTSTDARGTAPSSSTAAASASASASATVEMPASSAPGIGPDGTTEPTAPATSQPTVPRAELTPATGTFTATQRNYLVGKVPTGMDPSAVLQTGQESCERIANTADSSPALARQAIKDGEIADARDAIIYLCPKYRNLLD